MQIALLTIGDELLSGETENTNATWLARQLTDRGVSVSRIAVIPDEVAVIARHVSEYSEAFDSVIVTGGLGGTPDDVTINGVARAFDRPLEPDDAARADIEATLASYREHRPDLDIDLDIEAEAALPAGGRALLNEAGLSPGCVVENVYILPGIPEEMQAMFSSVADEFSGDVQMRALYTEEPESNLIATLSAVRDRFDVSVGCYPNRAAGHNRLVLRGTDDETLDAATEWLRERCVTVENGPEE